ncbi:MAG: SMC-Scp complex subunit ScpB [Oscillospiraceae bacterium]|nr:SMC-Scp complex subunit ScpB [Oscillospiraceae bacterium]
MTDAKNYSLKNSAEAIIFASGEPVERARLIDALGCSPEKLNTALNELRNEYDDRGSAVELLLLGSKAQFATRPQYAEAVRTVLDMKRNQPLSSAAFEVLAVVAYNQPVTRSFIEQVRGVDCGGVINTLCQRNLIEECGRLDLPGRPLIYCTTTDFLKCFCMSTLAELPEIPDTKAAAAALENIQSDVSGIDGQISIL